MMMSGSKKFERTRSDTESGIILVRVAPPGRIGRGEVNEPAA